VGLSPVGGGPSPVGGGPVISRFVGSPVHVGGGPSPVGGGPPVCGMAVASATRANKRTNLTFIFTTYL
jgi:hypothetical protein